MDDRSLTPQDLPRECEIVELCYRIKKPEATHLDLTVRVEGGKERSLRFHRPRVVQFDKDLPDILHDLEVQDVRAQNLGESTIWVSIGHGAVTFWAKDVVELSRFERVVRADTSPPVKPWELLGAPVETYNYRAPRGGAFRSFSISTRPYGEN
jgi:hypothetical protein